MKSYLGSLICRFKGHKWRRLRRKEGTDGDMAAMRICDRCGIYRPVKQRRVK